MAKTPVVCAWSGGKDSALMVHALRQSEDYAPAMLLTTLTEPFSRISMHGVRRELL
ncbi:MAG: ATP-binding protein, partial [Alphaproteobacteria bacterium]|nr:ATP-binding protein [Alphaproteobacteria bacterium]